MWHNVCGCLQEKGVIEQKLQRCLDKSWQWILRLRSWDFTQDEPFLLMFSGVYGKRRFQVRLAGGHVTLSADTVNFWSCRWSCGWLRGAVASLGSALGFLLQRKHRHVSPIMTYIKPSHYVSRKEAEVKCHLSPFSWCLTMTSFAQAGPSPMGEEAWFTDCCCWLWLPGDLLPIPHSTVLCGQKSKRKNPEDQWQDLWVMFCFFCQPSTE